MANLEALYNRIGNDIRSWIEVREVTIQKIQDTAERLRKHRKNVNISRIAGSSASIFGTALAIIGFGLSPVTLGGSLIISVTGVSFAVAGGITAAGSSIADVALQKSNVKEAQEQLTRDYDQLEAIKELSDKIKNIIEKLEGECPNVSSAQIFSVIEGAFTLGLIRTGGLGLRLAETALFRSLEIGGTALRVGGAAAKGIAAAGIALNVVLIPIDLIEIVRSSYSLKTGSESDAVKKLKEIAHQLEVQKLEITAKLNTECE